MMSLKLTTCESSMRFNARGLGCIPTFGRPGTRGNLICEVGGSISIIAPFDTVSNSPRSLTGSVGIEVVRPYLEQEMCYYRAYLLCMLEIDMFPLRFEEEMYWWACLAMCVVEIVVTLSGGGISGVTGKFARP